MSPPGAPNNNTLNTITDVNGNIVMQIRQDEYVVVSNDNSVTSYAHYKSITLVCGTVWNPTMMFAKPAVLVGVCGVCRQHGLFKKRTHGLVAMHMAKLCVCGKLCCPQHRRLGKDGKWRCPVCHNKYRMKKLFRPVFFKSLED